MVEISAKRLVVQALCNRESRKQQPKDYLHVGNLHERLEKYNVTVYTK